MIFNFIQSIKKIQRLLAKPCFNTYKKATFNITAIEIL